MAYTNTYTGITTYADSSTSAAQNATAKDPAASATPSTATSFAQAPSPTPPTGSARGYSQNDFYGLTSNLGHDVAGGYKDFSMPLYAINPRTGSPEIVYVTTTPGENGLLDATQSFYFGSDGALPNGAEQGLAGGYSAGKDKHDLAEPAIIAGLAALSGGMFGPALAGATGLSTAAATGAVGGATGAAIGSGGDPNAIGKGAVVGGLGGGVASGVSGAVGGGLPGATTGGLVSGGLNAAATGADVGRGALLGGITSGGARGVAEGVTPGAPSLPSTVADVSPMDVESLKRGMLPGNPLFAQADTGSAMDVTPGMLSPADAQTLGPIAGQKLADAVALNASGTLSADVPGVLTATDSQSVGPIATQKVLEAAGYAYDPSTGVYWRTGEPSPGDAAAREQQIQKNAATVEKLTKFATALGGMHNGQGLQGAPSRTRTNADGSQQQLSDADYSRELTDYAQIDPQALHLRNPPVLDSASLAQMGLVPGTPEYMAYVMDQMDSVIGQLTDGVDPNSPDIAQQLRGKTNAELEALTRALYIRGQMQLLVSSGTYTDPVTGRPEDVIVPQGQLVQPSLAAYQRGVARSAQELATMQNPDDARRYAGGMLSRGFDPFGMNAAAAERAREEALANQDVYEDPLKRRGLGGFAPADWHELLNGLTPMQLRQLLAGFGGR